MDQNIKSPKVRKIMSNIPTVGQGDVTKHYICPMNLFPIVWLLCHIAQKTISDLICSCVGEISSSQGVTGVTQCTQVTQLLSKGTVKGHSRSVINSCICERRENTK